METTPMPKTDSKADGHLDYQLKSAVELSALDLNNIKLDTKHTVLTPQYLDNLIANNPST